MAKKKLGEILLERGVIDQDQLNSALAYQRQWGHRLGSALVAKGFITEGMLIKVLGEVMSLPTVDLSKVEFDPQALRMIPFTTCENNDLIPIRLEPGRGKEVIVVAMADPMNLAVIDEIEFTTGRKTRPVLATISAINSAIRKYYRGMNTTIKPLSLYRPKTEDTGKMVVVHAGGASVEVDTSTDFPHQLDQNTPAKPADRPVPGKQGDKHVLDRVEQIKARRARQVSKNTNQRISSDQVMENYLREVQTADLETLAKIEKYFWALMRVLAKKGIISKEEFLREMEK